MRPPVAQTRLTEAEQIQLRKLAVKAGYRDTIYAALQWAVKRALKR